MMTRDKRKILVIGNMRIPLPRLSRVRELLFCKLQIADVSIPVLWFVIVAVVVVAAILLVNFGPGQQKPDPAGSGAVSGVSSGSGGSDSGGSAVPEPVVPEVNPNKGKFIIEKIDANTNEPIANGAVGIEATSEDTGLADAVKAEIASKGSQTDAQGRLTLDLPTLPWAGGKNLTLTVTEAPTATHIGMQAFTVEIEYQNGTVVSAFPAPGEQKRVSIASDEYGVSVTSQPVVTDNSFYDAALRTWVKKVDRVSGGETTDVFYDENPNISDIPVQDGDKILVRVDVYNQSLNRVTIPEIAFTAPAGLTFDPAATIAHIDPAQPAYTNNDWELASGGDGQATKLRYKGDPILIDPWNGHDNIYPEKRYAIVLTANVALIPPGPGGDVKLSGYAEILKLQDGDGNDVQDNDSIPDDTDSNDGVASDNNIEEHRKSADGATRSTQDEDDQDVVYVTVSGVPAAEPAEPSVADGASETDIQQKPVAQESAAFKLWMLIPILIAAAAIAVCIWMFYGGGKRKKRKASRRHRRGV